MLIIKPVKKENMAKPRPKPDKPKKSVTEVVPVPTPDPWRCTAAPDNRERSTMQKSIEVDLFGELDEVIPRLQALAQKYPKVGVRSVRLERVWDGYEDCHDELIIERDETDQEWMQRVRKIDEQERIERTKADAVKSRRKRIEDLQAEIKRLEKEL